MDTLATLSKNERRRTPAKKVRILDILNGKYVPGDKEQMRASYVITPFGEKVSRVNVLGTVTEKFLSDNGNFSSVTIDDSTSVIRIRAFGEDVNKLRDLELGGSIIVIGKVKQYNGETYVNVEIAKRISDSNVESFRKMELLKSLLQRKTVVDEIRKMIDETSEEELIQAVKERYGMDQETLQVVRENLRVQKQIDYKPKMLEVIAALDDGSGVEIGRLLQISDLPENVIESAINELLANGSLFEPSPGKLRKV